MDYYETSRVEFEKLVLAYRNYQQLYRWLNAGSLRGSTPFVDYYWRRIYYHRHMR